MKMLAVIKIFIICTVLVFTISCNRNDCKSVFLLPSGNKFICPTIDSLYTENLTFEPYTGLFFKAFDSFENYCYKVVLHCENEKWLYNDDGKTFDEVYNSLKDKRISHFTLNTFVFKDITYWDSLLTEGYKKHHNIVLKRKTSELETNKSRRKVGYYYTADGGKENILAEAIINKSNKCNNVKIFAQYVR